MMHERRDHLLMANAFGRGSNPAFVRFIFTTHGVRVELFIIVMFIVSVRMEEQSHNNSLTHLFLFCSIITIITPIFILYSESERGKLGEKNVKNDINSIDEIIKQNNKGNDDEMSLPKC